MASRRLLLEGKRFGRLLVQRFVMRDRFGAAMWECMCDCGNTVTIRSNSLTSGNSLSCGCLQKDAVAERAKKDTGEAAFRNVYNSYKCRAERKGLAFSLADQEFKSLTTDECFYCGAPPQNTKKSGYENGDYIYNGIDRIDNSHGYELSNCVTCCRLCNRAKADLSLSDFKILVDKIHARLNNS